MEARKPPEFVLELSADRSNVKDVVKGMPTRQPKRKERDRSIESASLTPPVAPTGILHALFFHRLFTPLAPSTHELLDLTLPFIPPTADSTIPALIETRTTALLRHLDSLPQTPTATTTSPQYNPTTQRPQTATVTLAFLEKKRRKGWFVAKADEETTWETWTIRLTLLSARSEIEAGRNRRVMERQLGKAVVRVVEVVNRERAHIPPITTNEGSLFPCQITVGGGGGR